MNLGEFHTMVREAVRRGNAEDAAIVRSTKFAALWMERNYTFQYMKQFLEVEIDLEVVTAPRYIELGPGAPKQIKLFRWNDEGTYTNLTRIEPEDMDSLEEGTPNQYWLDGIRRIVLNKTPDENLSGEIALVRYTPWPTELTFNHFLLDRASDVMLAQTMLYMATHLKDPRMKPTYQEMRDEGLKTLINAEDEILYGDEDPFMEYLPSA